MKTKKDLSAAEVLKIGITAVVLSYVIDGFKTYFYDAFWDKGALGAWELLIFISVRTGLRYGGVIFAVVGLFGFLLKKFKQRRPNNLDLKGFPHEQ